MIRSYVEGGDLLERTHLIARIISDCSRNDASSHKANQVTSKVQRYGSVVWLLSHPMRHTNSLIEHRPITTCRQATRRYMHSHGVERRPHNHERTHRCRINVMTSRSSALKSCHQVQSQLVKIKRLFTSIFLSLRLPLGSRRMSMCLGRTH